MSSSITPQDQATFLTIYLKRPSVRSTAKTNTNHCWTQTSNKQPIQNCTTIFRRRRCQKRRIWLPSSKTSRKPRLAISTSTLAAYPETCTRIKRPTSSSRNSNPKSLTSTNRPASNADKASYPTSTISRKSWRETSPEKFDRSSVTNSITLFSTVYSMLTRKFAPHSLVFLTTTRFCSK